MSVHAISIGVAETETETWFKDMRGWIMVVAVQVATMAYVAGLSPPGGFWQDDRGNHTAGDPILLDKIPTRYHIFFYANASAFMASLVIIILIMNEKFYCNKAKIIMLYISMVSDLISLMIAFSAGCSRIVSTSIYVIVLAAVVLLWMVFSSRFVPPVWCFLVKCSPCMKGLCPVQCPGDSAMQDIKITSEGT